MLFFILPLLLPVFIFSQSNQLNDTNNSEIYRTECKTPASTPEQILATKELVENWLSQGRNRPDEQINILVAFHVIHASDGTGNISDAAIYDQFDWLNLAFASHNIYFTVDTIDRTENDEWFNNWWQWHN